MRSSVHSPLSVEIETDIGVVTDPPISELPVGSEHEQRCLARCQDLQSDTLARASGQWTETHASSGRAIALAIDPAAKTDGVGSGCLRQSRCAGVQSMELTGRHLNHELRNRIKALHGGAPTRRQAA